MYWIEGLEGFQRPLIQYKSRGGTCVYITEGLQYIEVTPPQKTSESNWFVVKTKNEVSRIYACIYRSPNSDNENNEKLLENIRWATANYSEVVIIGDINVPAIDWENESSSTVYGRKLLDCINNSFLEQLIEKPTRFWEGNNPSLLVLLITNKPDIISDLRLNDPFGKCDHVSIHFTVATEIKKCNERRIRYDYTKMDSDIFDNLIGAHNWEEKIETSDLNET